MQLYSLDFLKLTCYWQRNWNQFVEPLKKGQSIDFKHPALSFCRSPLLTASHPLSFFLSRFHSLDSCFVALRDEVTVPRALSILIQFSFKYVLQISLNDPKSILLTENKQILGFRVAFLVMTTLQHCCYSDIPIYFLCTGHKLRQLCYDSSLFLRVSCLRTVRSSSVILFSTECNWPTLTQWRTLLSSFISIKNFAWLVL